MHRLPHLAALAAVSFASPTRAQEVISYTKPPNDQDTAAKKDERMRWFRDARFDADTGVRPIANAGVKYLCITPFKLDPLEDLSEACKRYDVTFCTDPSIRD